MTGGDEFSIRISLGAGARLLAGTAAAEKIYRSTGANAAVTLAIDALAGSRCFWLPQETILFDRARLSRRIDVNLSAGATLVMPKPSYSAVPPWAKPCMKATSLIAGAYDAEVDFCLLKCSSGRHDCSQTGTACNRSRCRSQLLLCWPFRPTKRRSPPYVPAADSSPVRLVSPPGTGSR